MQGFYSFREKYIPYIGRVDELLRLASKLFLFVTHYIFKEDCSMKVFISQPMAGLDIDRITKDRDRIIEKFHLDRKDVMDTIHKENVPEGASSIWYLGGSIQQLDKADLIIFAMGWEKARGCVIEHSVCEAYGKPVVYELYTKGGVND